VKRKLVILIVSVMLLFSTAAVDSCDSGTSVSPGIGDIQTLVDQQVLTGGE
jgi:hypothetical protein